MPPTETPPRQGESTPDAILRAAAVGGVATTAASTAPGAAGAAGVAVTGAQVAEAVAAAVAALRGRGSDDDASWLWLVNPMVRQDPDLGPSVAENDDLLTKATNRESGRDAEFYSRMEDRLRKDIPAALASADPEAAVAAVLERERGFLAQHDEAAATRVHADLRRQRTKELSPQGAFWKMSPLVKEHTPDCIAMATVGWWPWPVLDRIHPPMHGGCPCDLWTHDEAKAAGLMGDRLPDTSNAVERARQIAEAHGIIQEAYWLGTDSERELAEAVAVFTELVADPHSPHSGSIPTNPGPLDIAEAETQAQHEGIMVALYPDGDLARELALNRGEHPDQLHVTLAFLGKTGETTGEQQAMEAVREWAEGCPPLQGEISGYGHFLGGDGKLTYASVDLPDLPAQRERLVSMLDAATTPPRRDHGFTPHMTLDYASRRPKIDKPIPLTFSHVTLAWGDDHYRFPLTGVSMAKQIQEGMVDWAKEELERAGAYDEDGDYGGMLGPAILDCVKTFSEAGHSGFSAGLASAALEKLLRWQPLTPLTSDPDEWMHIDEDMAGQPDLWQSKRNPAAFSNDGGKTWKIMEAREQGPLTTLDLEEIGYDKRFAKGTIYGGRFMPKRGGYAPKVPIKAILHDLLGTPQMPGRGSGRKGRTRNLNLHRPGMASPPTPQVPDAEEPPRRPGAPPEHFEAAAADIRSNLATLAARAHKPFDLKDVEAEGFDTEGFRDYHGHVRVGAEGAANLRQYAEDHARQRRVPDDTAAGAYHTLRTLHHEAIHSLNPLSPDEYNDPVNFAFEEAITEELAHVLTVEYLRQHGMHDALRWKARSEHDMRAEGVYLPQRAALRGLLDDAQVEPGAREELLRTLSFNLGAEQRRNVLAGLIAKAQGISAEDAHARIDSQLGKIATANPVDRHGAAILRPQIDADSRSNRAQVGEKVYIGKSVTDPRGLGTVTDAGWGEDGKWHVEIETTNYKGDTVWRYPNPEEVHVSAKDKRETELKGDKVEQHPWEGEAIDVTHLNGKTEEMDLRRVEPTDEGTWSAEAVDSHGRAVLLGPDNVQKVIPSSKRPGRLAQELEDSAHPPETTPGNASKGVSEHPAGAVKPGQAHPGPYEPVPLTDVTGPQAFDARNYQDPRRSLIAKVRALKPGQELQMADGSTVLRGKTGDSALITRPDGSKRRYATVNRLANAETPSIAARHGLPYDVATQQRGDTKLALDGMASPGLPKIFGKLKGEPHQPPAPPADDLERSEHEAPPEPVTGIPEYDGSGLTDVKAAGGSNGARFAEDPKGNRWLVKTYKGDRDRVGTELLANSIYRELGIAVPNAGHTEVDVPGYGPTHALTYPLVDGELRHWSKPDEQLAEGFVADALLANWDVVGLDQDNVLWNGDQPIRLDQGGTLEYRAMGQKKPFGNVPAELWTMQKGGGQANGRMAITDAGLRAQAKDAELRLTPEKIDELADAAPFADEAMRDRVKAALKERVAWLGRFSRGEENLPEPLSGDETAAAFAARDESLQTTPDEDEAIDYYDGPGRAIIDQHLRSGAPKEEGDDTSNAAIASLDALLNDPVSKSPDEFYAYMPAPDSLANGDNLGAVKGKWFTERSYLNLDTAFPEAQGVVRVTVPAGFPAIMPSTIEGAEAEGSGVILPRNLKIQIADVKTEDGRTILDATVKR